MLDNLGASEGEVWGSGLQMRDFIHIDDCIEGVMRMKDRIVNGDAVNLSTGRYTSFKDLTIAAARTAGYDPEVRPLSDKPEGVFARGGDTAKQIAFGFSARISLDEGVARGLNYLSSQHTRSAV